MQHQPSIGIGQLPSRLLMHDSDGPRTADAMCPIAHLILVGVRMGAEAPACNTQLPGHLQLHGALPAVGPARLQHGARQQPCCRPTGHGRRHDRPSRLTVTCPLS